MRDRFASHTLTPSVRIAHAVYDAAQISNAVYLCDMLCFSLFLFLNFKEDMEKYLGKISVL